MRLYQSIFKRFLDIVGSICGMILSIPIIILVLPFLLVSNKGQILFLQKRAGLGGSLFYVFKFKTMTDRRQSNGKLLPDKDRLTFIGKLLRTLSLDELPQLLNVVKGDMSLVGPRPLLPDYLPLYNNFQKRRHEVRPGITGWAQVNGRNTISWEAKFEFDVWYVDNVSFFLDLKIIALTLLKTLKREGISSVTTVTMERFNGS